MIRKLDMRGTDRRHIKTEWEAIVSMGRGEMLEILYDDAGLAMVKAEKIRKGSRGTDCPVSAAASDNAVIVTRL